MKLSRDAWLALGLFALLLAITIAAAIQQAQPPEDPPYTSRSSAPQGAQALRLWLEALDYAIDESVGGTFQPPETSGLIFMLEPFSGITTKEWQLLDGWVEAGGTLILAGDRFGTVLAVEHYEVSMAYTTPVTESLTSQTPLLPVDAAQPQPQAYFRPSRQDFVTHLALKNRPILISFSQGEGQVILSAAPYPFSNAGLKESGNPELVLSLVKGVDPQGEIWFDEWHHGLRSREAVLTGPGHWLRYTPAGRSLLYVALLIFVALLLRGRRFGRPVSLPEATHRRAPLEYITAIANLNRRAGHRRAVLRQYYHWLKRGLGRRYRLDPALSDRAYLEQLERLNPALDTVALGQLLSRLQQKNLSENEMVHLTAQVTTWLEKS